MTDIINHKYIQDFSVIIRNNKHLEKSERSSNAQSIKPLVYFSTVFGMKFINYSSGKVTEVKVLSKLYCIFFMLATISLFIFVKPFSWKYTLQDIPLNILTKCFGIFTIFEALYSVVIINFSKSPCYVEILKLFDDLDYHFGISKSMPKKRFVMSSLLVILPLLQGSCTFWMRKFSIYNIGYHLIFFLVMLQGAIIIFFASNIFINYLMLNHLLINKTNLNIPEHKSILFGNSFFGRITKVSTYLFTYT